MPEFLVSDPNEAVLEITVLDSDLFSPNGERGREGEGETGGISYYAVILVDFLGCAKLSLKELREESGNNGPWTKRILLEDVPKGELALRVTYTGTRRVGGSH